MRNHHSDHGARSPDGPHADTSANAASTACLIPLHAGGTAAVGRLEVGGWGGGGCGEWEGGGERDRERGGGGGRRGVGKYE